MKHPPLEKRIPNNLMLSAEQPKLDTAASVGVMAITLSIATTALQQRWANLARLSEAIASGQALYDRELADLSAAGELDSKDSKSLRRRK